MTTELKEFIEICSDKRIQDKVAYKGDFSRMYCREHKDMMKSDNYSPRPFRCNYMICLKNLLYLPTIDQLIEMLGDRFGGLERLGKIWQFYTPDRHTVVTAGQSARIALARACKEVLNGK